ncbi:MAG: alpha/beta hydrolase [Marivibrio sp.]|uniref:alpha/beta fold hydrolase n=1 Tax=Marivibrio sp. TaxID=2039719 RepID=UPI0032EC725E
MSGADAPSPFLAQTVRAQDGCRLFVRDYRPVAPPPGDRPPGDRPVVLCLGGVARTSADFHDLAQRLAAQGWRVVAPDYRGRGRSARSAPRRYRPEVYLEDLRHIRVALGLGPAVVIGSSLGGLLGCALGVAAPGALKGLVMNDIGPDVSLGGLGRVVDYIKAAPSYADWDDAAAAMRDLMPDLNPGPGETAGEDDWRRVAEATFRREADGRLHPMWDPAIAESMGTDAAIPDLWPLFRSARRAPALAIRGGKSDILSAETLQRMQAAHPLLSALTLPHKGHTPTLDEPESLAAIEALLARVAGASDTR